MKANCSTCEFNFDAVCAGHGNTYQYGEAIVDPTKCCDDWSPNLEYYKWQTANAPRFLKERLNDCSISYTEFSKQYNSFLSGSAVPINIFDAIKYIYGISMVDIAVVLNVTFGVVYRAKVKGIPQKRIQQFANELCIPEKFLHSITTNDFDELKECKQTFFQASNIDTRLTSMPEWKEDLSQKISAIYLHCPIHLARIVSRVDKLYWSINFPLNEYTESEKTLIGIVSKKSKKYPPAQFLEYALDIGCNPHMRLGMECEAKNHSPA